MIINPLLNQIALTTGPTVTLPNGTKSRNIRYYLPILEESAQESGTVYASLFDLYKALTSSPPGTLPDTPGEAVAMAETAQAQVEAGTTQLNLFGNANAGVPGTDTTLIQAIGTQFTILAGYIGESTGIFARTTDAIRTVLNAAAPAITNLKDTRTAIGTIADQVDNTVIAWAGATGVWAITPATTIIAINAQLPLASVATQVCIDAANDLNNLATGAAPAANTAEAAAALVNSEQLITETLAYINANAGALITGSGAPYATLRDWAIAQGFVTP